MKYERIVILLYINYFFIDFPLLKKLYLNIELSEKFQIFF
jgi:hypothetical protein